MGDCAHLKDILANNVVDEVFLCLPVRSYYATIQEMAHKCEQVGVSVRMIADLFPLRHASSRFHKLDDIQILALSTVPENQPQLVLQRVTDILIAATALALFSPILFATALAIKLTSSGPIFFKQQRICLYQRPFNMIKFRSMVLTQKHSAMKSPHSMKRKAPHSHPPTFSTPSTATPASEKPSTSRNFLSRRAMIVSGMRATGENPGPRKHKQTMPKPSTPSRSPTHKCSPSAGGT